MTAPSDKVRARMAKLLALARAGVGGEKDNAERMLANLLAKHGMTLADLTDESEKRTDVVVPYKGAHERKLLLQIAAKVFNSLEIEVWSYRGKRALVFNMTQAQRVELLLHFETLRKPLAKAVQKAQATAVSAFVQVNRLFPSEASDRDEEPMSPEDLAALVAAMRGIEPTPVHRQLKAA